MPFGNGESTSVGSSGGPDHPVVTGTPDVDVGECEILQKGEGSQALG